jgi:hypothetical protein
LNRRGVKAEEWIFSTTSVGQIAVSLVQTFRNELIWIPDAPVLKDELLSVRLRESAPGVSRLDHDRSGHDDQAVVIGMACNLLIGRVGWGPAAFKQFMKDQADKIIHRKTLEERALERLQRVIGGRKDRGERLRKRQQRTCQHIWRETAGVTTCAFCGAEKPELAA